MHKCALSEQGAKDMIKAFVSVTVSNLVLMVPIALLYYMVKDYMEGNLAGKGFWYVAGIVVTFVLIAVTTYIQYNATFLATNYTGREIEKDPAFLFREKRSVRSYEYDHGGLCPDGNGIVAFCSGTCRSLYFDDNRCHRIIFL